MEYLNNLNEDQKEVVLYNEGPMAVMSGAGSGKTHTLVAKVRYLVEELQVKPRKIVVVTLTKKAAEEMKDRLRTSLGSDTTDKLQVSTIHSFAYKVYKSIKNHYNAHEKLPQIMVNDFEPFLMLLSKAKEKNLANKAVMDHLSIIAWNKTRIISLDSYKEETQKLRLLEGKENEIRYRMSVESTWKDYEDYLKKKGKMDFTDILLNCHYELENKKNEEYVSKLSKSIEYLIVDEAQDTTMLSFKILEKLAEHHKRIILIGDVKQSIYKFMGAEVKNITEFISKYNPKIVDLKINYRSTKNIVENANYFIKGKNHMLGKPAITPNIDGNHIVLNKSRDEHEEADWVLNKVEQLLREGVQPREIAIIYRVHSLARAVEDRFVLNGVPYISYSDTGFYQRKETKDILSYLKLMIKPSNMSVSLLKRIGNKPTRYLKNEIYDELEYFAIDNNIDLYQALAEFRSNDFSQTKNVQKLYEELRAGNRLVNNGATTIQLIEYVLKSIGYEKWANEQYKEKESDSDIIMNLDAVLSSAKNWANPVEFLNFIEEVEHEEIRKKDESGNYVQLMTIHRVKGKEFKHVFVISVCDRCYPFHKSSTIEELEEEERIMYVAITRPKEYLYLSTITGKLGRFDVYPSHLIKQMKTDLFIESENFYGSYGTNMECQNG